MRLTRPNLRGRSLSARPITLPMIDPKSFYRKMDQLLVDIGELHADGDFLPRILKALEVTFGDEMNIGCGHLFEEIGESWVLKAWPAKGPTLDDAFPVDSITTTLLNRHGGYIFDNPEESPELYADRKTEHAIPAAFVVSQSTRRWMFVYCLLPGWTRDEVAFCLNGVRSALNHRLGAEAIKSDLEQAAEIQRSLLPSRPPVFPGFDIAARTQPAEAVGGDFYDFILMEDDILGVAIGDASGHGMPAALLVRDVIMGLRMGMGTHMKMLYTLKKLNREIHRTTLSTRFISVFYGEIELNGNFLYANAGHSSGLIFNGAGVTHLNPTGTILGPLPNIPLDRAYGNIPAGGLLVLYTDGVTERVEADNTPFETEGLIRLVRENRHLGARQLVDCIFDQAVSLNHESDRLEDDATVVVVKRNPIA